MSISSKKILFISGSLGLGHIVRDLAIAKELRKRIPAVEIHWIAAHPATILLAEAGESILPEAEDFANYNVVAEKVAQSGFRLNIIKYAFNATSLLMKNLKPLRQAIARQHYDIVIGDEAYELFVGLMKKKIRIDIPFVMILDFFGMDPLTLNPFEKLFAYLLNITLLRSGSFFSRPMNTALFIGEAQDIADKPLGFLMPNRRKLAEKFLQFVGYVLPFNPADYVNSSSVKTKLGYGQEPLVVCSIGGTAVGKELLNLCCKAYPIVRKEIPDVRMLVVCGPRLEKRAMKVPEGVEVKGYVPCLYKYLAASDLAIVQAGGTTTLELTALKRPFLYFPLEGHFEQQVHVSEQLARHKAGIRMSYKETTSVALAEKVISTIGSEVDYLPVPTDGAQKATEIISRLI